MKSVHSLCLKLALIFSLTAVLTVEGQASYHDIRLVDRAETPNSYKGRLEVLLNGQWGTVCDDSFGITEANVACKQLGFEGAATFDFVPNLVFATVPSNNNPPILLDEVWCEPTDTSIQDCSHSGVGIHDCAPFEAVGLVCLTNGTFRLAHDIYFGYHGYGELDKTLGRLEVYMMEEWGTVCGTGFSETEADIACQSMGFPRAEYHGPYYHFGLSIASESTPIWLEEVRCSVNDSTLLECAYSPLDTNTSCTHWDDIGLVCSADLGLEIDALGVLVIALIGVFTTLPICITPMVICCCVCAAISYSKKKSSNTSGPRVVHGGAQTTAYPVQAPTTGQMNTLQPPLYSPTVQPISPLAQPPQQSYPVHYQAGPPRVQY